MEIGDILYFLFIIGGIVYSFIKKSNSNKEKQNTAKRRTESTARSTPKPEVDNDIEEFLRSLTGEPKQTPKQTSPDYESQEDSYDDEYEEENSQPFESHKLEDLKKEQRQKRSAREEALLGKDISKDSPIYKGLDAQEQERKSEFNLRKAVIYDAIMNRPKY